VSGVVLIPGNTTESNTTAKTEVFFVDYGAVEIRVAKTRETLKLRRGAHFFLPAGTKYTIQNTTNTNCVLVFFTPS
jgi:glyoxylate utilization-related uncharacterized protein